MDAKRVKPAILPGNGLAVPDIERIDAADGSFILRSRQAPRQATRCIGDWLEHWSASTPNALFLAERAADGECWRKLTYAETRRAVGGIAQALLDMGLGAQAPVVILSDNSVDVALLKLAAMHVGIPVAVISSAYTLSTPDHTKLHGMLRLLKPGLLYASDGARFNVAMHGSGIGCPRIFSSSVPVDARSFASLLAVDETPAVAAAFEKVTPDSQAKYLLTSGSTGAPKAVVNTHRMLCANQEAIAQVWPFLEREAPVLLDWLPWSHTFGANHNFNMVLRNGGSLYVDEGRPLPALLPKTVRNLRDVQPTLLFNVPKGYDALLPILEQDEELAARLFANLDVLFFAAAALPQQLADRLSALAARHRTTPLLFASAWGSTETSPVVTSVHFKTTSCSNLGVPVPGVELKFVPNQGKLELRVRGPSVFSEYRGAPELTDKAFDADGFYLIGDAGKLADPADPNAGVLFDGRVSEDFKLMSGTWVSVGTLRIAAVGALSPLAQDVVVAGHGRDAIGLLIFPSPALREMAGDTTGTATGMQLAAHPGVRARVGEALAVFNAGRGSASRVARAVLLSTPPELSQGESTDKGYINQRAVLERRAHEVARLYGDDASVIFPA